jgi:hypothetical protein
MTVVRGSIRNPMGTEKDSPKIQEYNSIFFGAGTPMTWEKTKRDIKKEKAMVPIPIRWAVARE